MARKFAIKVLHPLQIIIVFLSKSSIYCKRVKQFERNYIKLLIILKDPSYSRNAGGSPKNQQDILLKNRFALLKHHHAKRNTGSAEVLCNLPVGLNYTQAVAGWRQTYQRRQNKHWATGDSHSEKQWVSIWQRNWLWVKSLSSVIREIK